MHNGSPSRLLLTVSKKGTGTVLTWPKSFHEEIAKPRGESQNDPEVLDFPPEQSTGSWTLPLTAAQERP